MEWSWLHKAFDSCRKNEITFQQPDNFQTSLSKQKKNYFLLHRLIIIEIYLIVTSKNGNRNRILLDLYIVRHPRSISAYSYRISIFSPPIGEEKTMGGHRRFFPHVHEEEGGTNNSDGLNCFVKIVEGAVSFRLLFPALAYI